jgi:hypothetical protein
MATVSEFKRYAVECKRWAAEAKTEEDRKALLELAHDWTLAAVRLEGTMSAADNETEPLLKRTGRIGS